MKQTDLGLDLNTRRTRKMELPALMTRVVPWPQPASQLTAVSPPTTPPRPPFGHETMLLMRAMPGIGTTYLADTRRVFPKDFPHSIVYSAHAAQYLR